MKNTPSKIYALVAIALALCGVHTLWASGETINLSIGTLPPGKSVTISFQADVDSAIPSTVTQVCNQGLFSGENIVDELTDDPSIGGSADPTCTVVAQADLGIAKSDSADSVTVGQSFSYSVTVFNDGPSDAQDVAVTDTLPPGVTFVSTSGCLEDLNGVPSCSLGTIPAGSSSSFTINVVAGLSPGTVTNTASVTSTTHDPNPNNNSASEDTIVVAAADLSIAKIDSSDPVAAGDPLVYTITVANAGPSDAENVSVSDTLPANVTFDSTVGCDEDPAGVPTCSLGTIAAGSSKQYTLTVTVDSPVPALLGALTNSASVSSATDDPDPLNNSTSESTGVDAAPDLLVTKDDSVDFAGPGSTISYVIDYSNLGDRISDSTIISETVPDYTTFDPINSSDGWTCSPATGVAGANCTINVGSLGTDGGTTAFAVKVDATIPTGVTETVNTVDIYGTSSTPDSNPDNNSFSLTTVLNEPPEITAVDPISQTVQYSDAIVGVMITATDSGPDDLTISTSWTRNGGSTEATPLPDALEIVPADAADACGPVASGGVECTWTLQGQMLEPESLLEIEVVVSDGSLESEPAQVFIEVDPEDAVVDFADTNPVAIQVDAPGGDSPLFTVTVDVTELDEPLGLAGDISLADVSMTLVAVGPGPNASPIGACLEVVTPGTPGTGGPFDYDTLTVTCTFDDVEVNTYNLVVVVDGMGYYLGMGEDVLTVFDPSLGFTTGGGWFYWPGTADPATSYPGDRTNFGYNMKYNKKQTNPRGSLLVIRHLPDDSIVRLKSNALDGLSLGTGRSLSNAGSFGWAAFTGKATYMGIGWPEPIGNHRFLVYVEDHGEPGAGVDRFWIEVTDKDGEVQPDLSLADPAQSNAEILEGGNIVVPHSPGGRGNQ